MNKEKIIAAIKPLVKSGFFKDKEYNIKYGTRMYRVYGFGIDSSNNVTISYSWDNGFRDYVDQSLSWIVDEFVKDMFNLIVVELDRNLF